MRKRKPAKASGSDVCASDGDVYTSVRGVWRTVRVRSECGRTHKTANERVGAEAEFEGSGFGRIGSWIESCEAHQKQAASMGRVERAAVGLSGQEGKEREGKGVWGEEKGRWRTF